MRRLICIISAALCLLFLPVQTSAEDNSSDGLHIDYSVTQLSGEASQIIEQYALNNTAPYLEQRLQLAEKTGLRQWVGSDGFLSEAFFDHYSPNIMTYDNLAILDPFLVGSTAAQQETTANSWSQQSSELLQQQTEGIAPLADPRAMSVQDKAYFTHTDGIGTISNGLWRLSNNSIAFCARSDGGEPNVGDSTSDPILVDNAALRKALYYGHGGPGDILTSRYGTTGAVVFTDDIVSQAYSGTSIGTAAAGGYWWRTYISGIYNEIQSKPDPGAQGYVAYIVNVNGSGYNYNGVWTTKQPLAYLGYMPKGTLQLKKASANTTITNNNAMYALAGAEYSVTNSSGTNCGTLTVQSNGTSNTLTLDYGTYTVKETKAPAGYALDTKSYSVTISDAAQDIKLDVKDVPRSSDLQILLKKVNAENKPLADAQFTVKYYDALYDTAPADSVKPVRSWVFKTDASGLAKLMESYKVSGDALYTNSAGNPCIPMGTITIQETKAPAGYKLNTDKTVIKITNSGTTESITYSTPIIRNQRQDITIVKRQQGTDLALKDVEFRLTAPDGTQSTVKTDTSGKILLTSPALGTWTLEETKAHTGYKLPAEKITFEITDTGAEIKGGLAKAEDRQIEVFNQPDDVSFTIHKESDSSTRLEGAQFTLYEDSACSSILQTVETNENGEARFTGLESGKTYWFKETKAPDGYRQDHTVHELTIVSTPVLGTFEYTLDGSTETVTDENDLNVTILNYTRFLLPVTGSSAMLTVTAMAAGAVALSFFFRKKQ